MGFFGTARLEDRRVARLPSIADTALVEDLGAAAGVDREMNVGGDLPEARTGEMPYLDGPAKRQSRRPSDPPIRLGLPRTTPRRTLYYPHAEQVGTACIESISDRVTPHSLRRTYASRQAASGDDPVYTAEQLGHTDPRFTLTVNTKAVKRRAKLSAAYLAEHEKALAWAALPTAGKARMGTGARSEDDEPARLPSSSA